MNRGNVLQSSPVQQMLAGGPNNWWNMMGSSRPPPSPPPPPPPPHHSPFFATSAQPHFFPHQYAPLQPPPSLSPWHHDNNQDFPDSLSQLLMSGLVGEDDKSALSHMQQQVKKLENWEEQLLHHHHQQQQQQHNSANVNSMVESAVKQENSLNYGSSSSSYVDFHGVKSNNWSIPMIPVSSPNSCISSLSNNMLDFSTTINNKPDGRHPPPDRSSECNSTAATGGASKKAKIQPSSNQSTFKVRKEKLGDRITALHQLVSPFGKTDTASVLLEAIGYIRFLQSQIEALSLPYLGSGSGNMRHPQHSVQQGERNCLFPEDPGQLLNDSCMKLKGSALDHQDSHEEPKIKDLRSRGLCLVPVSCTMQVGSDNGADYWAPALNGGFR